MIRLKAAPTTLALFLVAAIFLVALPDFGAAGYSAETISSAAPAEVPVAVREVLSDKAIRVNGPGGAICEIWLRKAVPAQKPSQQLGVVYGEVPEGTLVGVARFMIEVKDYRQQPVKPGIYTLRYALLPQNGNHLGVSPNRDFLLASPVSTDQKPASLPFEEILTLSRGTVGTGHPSVWSLASSSEAASTPKMLHQEDPDLWMVGFALNLQGTASNLSARSIWLVVVGHAPEA